MFVSVDCWEVPEAVEVPEPVGEVFAVDCWVEAVCIVERVVGDVFVGCVEAVRVVVVVGAGVAWKVRWVTANPERG